MSNCIYSANIEHNRKTITRLFRTRYYSYGKTRIVLRFCVGLAMIITAAAASIYMWAKGILLLLGAWLVSTPDFPAQVQADKVLEMRKNNLPRLSYEFSSSDIKLSGEGTNINIPYSKITRLIHDTEYCYLFISNNEACMLDKRTVTSHINPENLSEFMSFIENRTGLKWYREKSWIALNLEDLKQIFRR